MTTITETAIFDLVRTLKNGGTCQGFGHRVIGAAEARGLIKWDGARYVAAG